MPLPPIVNAVKTAIVHKLHGQDVINVVNWRFAGAPTATQMEDLAGSVAINWDLAVMTELSYELTLERVEARQLVPGSGLAYDFDLVPPVPGDNLADADNNATSVVVSLRTGQAGRSYRGRLFVGGIPNAVVSNGLLDSGFRTDIAAGVDAFLLTVAGDIGCTPVVVSYFSNNAQRVTPVMTDILSAISVTTYPGGQERRRPGIGS